jgi:hypothetical protein
MEARSRGWLAGMSDEQNDNTKERTYRALVLAGERGQFVLSIAMEPDVVNVSYKPKDETEHARLDASMLFAIPIEVVVLANAFVVAVRFP